MPTFTIPLTPDGAIVQAVITPSPDDESEGRELSIQGVLDTGAAVSVVDHSVVWLLGLKSVEKKLIHCPTTGTKPVLADMYEVNMRISAPGAAEPCYCVRRIQVVSFDLNRWWLDGHQALFGRNVLEHCLFSYNGVLQTFSLAYGGQG